jgi:hypothetical protein
MIRENQNSDAAAECVVDEANSAWNTSLGPVLTIIFSDALPGSGDEFIQLTDLPGIMFWPPLKCSGITQPLDVPTQNQWAYVILSNSIIYNINMYFYV